MEGKVNTRVSSSSLCEFGQVKWGVTWKVEGGGTGGQSPRLSLLGR